MTDQIINQFSELYVCFERDLYDISEIMQQIRLLGPDMLQANKKKVSFSLFLAYLKIEKAFTINPGKALNI
jgi:hypothetical protein